ncbi:hypothetical protein P692DRAFT_20653946, partial [Suillus brevipes Sb2]
SRKYKEAKRGTTESSQAFEELYDATDPDMVVRWEEQEKVAQASRIDNPSALDFYDVRLNKGESRKEIELDLLQTSFRRPGARPQLGAATWIASGITIEEVQIALAMDIRRMGRHPTETQTLEIGHRRIRLQHTIDEFIAGAQRYLGDDYDEDDNIQDMDVDFAGDLPDSTDEESDDDAEPGGNPRVLFQPERVLIPLPSNLGMDR